MRLAFLEELITGLRQYAATNGLEEATVYAEIRAGKRGAIFSNDRWDNEQLTGFAGSTSPLEWEQPPPPLIPLRPRKIAEGAGQAADKVTARRRRPPGFFG